MKKSVLTLDSWNVKEYGSDRIVIVQADKNSAGWKSTLKGFWIGNHRIFNGSYYIEFDILLNGIVIENRFFGDFGTNLKQAVPSCFLSSEIYYCTCDFGNYLEFPNLSILIDSHHFIIHAENYLQYMGDGKCKVLIYRNNDLNNWIIGLPYFKEYYNMFDMVKKEIHVSRAFRNGSSYNYFTAVVQSGLGILSAIAFAAVVVRVYKEKKTGEYQRI